ncbi:MAG: O-antigen ligase family protein [Parvularcula sp.]|nr:O-antigen ligase family protein [Parvularcula sp.]
MRAIIAVLCVVLVAWTMTYYRSRGSITFHLFLLFFAIYSIRIAYDTAFDPFPLGQPDYYYWAFAIGVSFLPALTLSLLATHLDIAKVALPIVLMGSVVMALAIWFGDTIVRNASGQTYDTGRLALESINPISLGHVGATVFLLIYWRVRRGSIGLVAFLFWLAAALLGFYGVLASGSRGPVIAMICGLLFIELIYGGRTLIILSIISAPILAILTIDISRLEASLGTNIFSRFETAISGTDASSLARVEQLSSAWSLFLNNFAFGSSLEDPVYRIYPHNIIVEAFMALGIFGGMLLIALLFSTCLRAFRLARSDAAQSAYGALFIQYMVAAQLSGGLYGSSAMWVLLGCIAGLQKGQIASGSQEGMIAHRLAQHRFPAGHVSASRSIGGARYQAPLSPKADAIENAPNI